MKRNNIIVKTESVTLFPKNIFDPVFSFCSMNDVKCIIINVYYQWPLVFDLFVKFCQALD